jgi:hypothetical protein
MNATTFFQRVSATSHRRSDELQALAKPDMPNDGRNNYNTGREVGDRWLLSEADPHPTDGKRRLQLRGARGTLPGGAAHAPSVRPSAGRQ